MKRLGVALVLVCLSVAFTAAVEFSGMVITSESSGKPIEGVLVQFGPGGDTVRTDSAGYFLYNTASVGSPLSSDLPDGFRPEETALFDQSGRIVAGFPADGMYIGRWDDGTDAYVFRVSVINGMRRMGRAVLEKRSGTGRSSALPITIYFSHKWFADTTATATLGIGTVLPPLMLAMDPKDARPTPYNTGYSGTLTTATSNRLDEDGEVFENMTFTGQVSIKASNTVLRNFKIDANQGYYGIKIDAGLSGITIENGEIINFKSCGILGVGYTGSRVYIHESNGDGMKAQGTGGPTLVENFFIEKLGKADGAHADGNQSVNGDNVTFRYNHIYMPYPGTPEYPEGSTYKSNATFFIHSDATNFLIENNWLVGGNYTIYGSDSGQVTVRNNIFGRYNGGYPTKEELRIKNGNFAEWSGNVWDDDGTACPE